MSGLGLTFLRRGNLAHPTAGSDHIKFADELVFSILMSKGVSSDGVGITKEDAARVTSISTWFQQSAIETFDEFEYFTNVTSLASNAFQNCTSLRSIVLPESIKTIGSSALYGCTALNLDEFDLRGTTSLGNNALFGTKIKRLIARSLTSFPTANSYTQNFGAKDSLEELIISENTSSLSTSFADGYSLLRVLTVVWSKIIALGGSALYNCSSLPADELNLENLTTIGSNALFGVKVKKLNLGKVATLPTSSQYTQTYGSKSTLEEIIIPGSVTDIPQYTLFTYAALKKVTIMEGVKTLGLSSIRGCSSLTNFDLPSTITSIASGVFAYSDNIQYGIIRAVTPPTLANVDAFVQNGGKTYPIYVPDESVAAYQSANVWSGIASRIKPLSELNR